MRGRSSPLMQETKEEGMKLDNKHSSKREEEEEDPPLSGASFHSLVKQLATTNSSIPKDTTMNTKDQGCVVDSNNVSSSSRNLRKHGKVLGSLHQQQHKKQVRRRLHTNRPYQERLMNMAEARKEIVTALKFHRASMKQAMEQQQQQQRQHQQQQKSLVSLQPSHHPSFEQDERLKYWSNRNPRINPSCITNFSTYMDERYFSSSSFSHPPPSVPNYYTWPIASPNITPPSLPLVVENPSISLPNQTLGLNLSFHDFNNFDPTLFPNNNINNNSSFCSYSSPTSIEGVSSSVVDTIESSATTQVIGGEGLHAAMDDEGMTEMGSLGEKYQMEWNDTMNLVTSARWSNFLNNMEHSAVEDDAYHHIFDELMEFPS